MDEEELYQEPVKKTVKPANQVQLTPEELNEEIVKVLTGDDPNVPRSISKFNFKDRCFKPDPPGQSDHMAVHFELSGCTLHVESDEYKVQRAREDAKEEEEQKAKKELIEKQLDDSSGILEEQIDNNKNQFNYSERACQTFNYPLKESGIATEPPPINNFGESVSQWKIYDAYIEDYINIMATDSSRKENNEKRQGQSVLSENLRTTKDAVYSKLMANALKIIERLVNQNANDEIYQDFKYWNDASDQYREGQGSLLPLWRFSNERTKRKQVTALCWNTEYTDLFAVGFGSYDFLRQGTGKICCYSLKNTSFPEYIFSTESGVMCLDFHPFHPSLLAVGCYDGTVLVYNICHSVRPIYASSVRTGKHTDPVWQISWQIEEMGKDLSFYSISTDGSVLNWTMSKNELIMEPIMLLKLAHATRKNDLLEQETNKTGLAGGCCFDFNKKFENLFLVGTEEGFIHQCSKAYNGQYLETYGGHHMPVYEVKWNPFHERIFLSCSADWTVKLWDYNSNKALMSFDLGNSVGGISWSPFSSTVFAAVTSDGKVHVFDISVNKLDPLCEQKVVKRSRLTHISFSSSDHILIVGDDRGGVNSLKLSPNLRKVDLPRDEKGNVDEKANLNEIQRSKLEATIDSLDAQRCSK